MPTMIAPPSTPMLSLAETPIVRVTEAAADDISDPVVPPAALPSPVAVADAPSSATWNEHEALLSGFLQHLQTRLNEQILERHKAQMEVFQGLCESLKSWIETLLLQQSGASNTSGLAAVLETLTTQGVDVHADPYTAAVRARTPQGFDLTISLVKHDPSELITGLDGLVQWLTASGYQPPS